MWMGLYPKKDIWIYLNGPLPKRESLNMWMDLYLRKDLWICEWTLTWERVFEHVNGNFPDTKKLIHIVYYWGINITRFCWPPPPFLNRAVQNNAHCVYWQRLANVHWKRLTNVHWQRFTNMHWQSLCTMTVTLHTGRDPPLHNDRDFA